MKRYISMFLVLGATVAAILYLVFTSGNNNREIILGEKVIKKVPTSEKDINIGQIIDATEKKDIKAKEGYRYKVFIQELSREGTAGIARIGGMITFVSNVKKGDVAIVQVTRVSRTTANAELIKIVKAAEIKKNKNENEVKVGNIYDVVIEQKSRKNPDKDGVAKINGLVVFVAGTQPSDKVKIRIIEKRDRFAVGQVIEKEEETGKTEKIEKKEVEVGDKYFVTIEQKDRKVPDKNGVVRINGLVVFVPDTQPGDKVEILITERRNKFAKAKKIK